MSDKPIKRQRFLVKSYIDPYSGLLKKDVFIDDKLFDWEVDEKSWKTLNEMGPGFREVAKSEILAHFCDSLSEFLGRKVSPGHIMKAIATGWI
jgi:hypothetical protein